MKGKFIGELSAVEAKFTEWHETYLAFYEVSNKSLPIDTTIKKMLGIKMLESAKGIHDWGLICKTVNSLMIKKTAQSKMLEAANTLQDYCFVLDYVKNEEIRKTIVDILLKKADTFNDWVLVYEYGPKTKKFRAKIFNIIKKMAKTPEEKNVIKQKIEEEKLMDQLTFQKWKKKQKPLKSGIVFISILYWVVV